MMKRAIVFTLAVLLCVTACSKKKTNSMENNNSSVPAVENASPAGTQAPVLNEAVKPAAAVQDSPADTNADAENSAYIESEDDIRAIFKDPKLMTGEELESILHSLEKCSAKNMGDWYNIRNCSAYKVFKEMASGRAGSRIIDPSIRRSVYMKFLKESENAAVRDFIYAQIDLIGRNNGQESSDIIGKDLDAIHQFLEIIRNEKDEIALAAAVGNLSTAADIEKIPAVCDYLFDTASVHPSVLVRRSLAEHISGTQFNEVEKSKSAIVKLCSDDDSKTRDAACGKIIDFNVPDAMNLAVEYLNDPKKSGAHGAIVSSLNKKWLSTENPDGTAYQIVYRYLSKQPRNETLPAWNGISSLGSGSGMWQTKEDEKYKAWKAAADFYEPEKFVGVLCSIIMDPNASYVSRLNSIDQVIRFGSADDLKPLSEALENNRDKREIIIFDAINEKIEEVTKPKNTVDPIYEAMKRDGVIP